MSHDTVERMLVGGKLTDKDILEIFERVGDRDCLPMEDARSQKDKLTDDQKRQIREGVAAEIIQIEALKIVLTEFKREKIPLAYLYAGVLAGDRKINDLDFAITTLIAMLKDPRVPEKYKGKIEDPEPRAIRLAITAALQVKRQEFQQNIKLVKELIDSFYVAREKGNFRVMENDINRLAAPRLRGAVSEHYQCKPGALRPIFDRLQKELDVVKKACK